MSEKYLRDEASDDGIDRRGFLRCMAWAGTATVWGLKGGVPMKAVYQTTVNAVRQKEQQLVKDAWEKVGLQTELNSVDSGVYFASDVTILLGPNGTFREVLGGWGNQKTRPAPAALSMRYAPDQWNRNIMQAVPMPIDGWFY